MNNNISRLIKACAESCREYVSIACEDPSAKKEILRGGGNNGGVLTRLLMSRPINSLRISEDALKVCLEKNVTPFDYFILTPNQLTKKYGCFFKSNKKTVEGCHEAGQYVTADHNIPNKAMIEKMITLCEENPDASIDEFRNILNQQSYDLITVEENAVLNEHGLKASGSKELRDSYCSPKIELVDLWLTPSYVIDKFFSLSGLNRNECLDPCASDGRWLKGEGLSYDILPMSKDVKKQDFLSLTKEQIPDNIKYIVGNIPFSLTKEFIEKALELRDECYFLVNGDTIFKYYPNNIKEIYIFSGMEGKQRDNRSKCEFDVPFLIKSQLWCCIVHITKEQQPAWNIETGISNDDKKDGYHVALGKNIYIKSDVPVDDNQKIIRIEVKSSIDYKGGKKIKTEDGEIIDLKNMSFLEQNIEEDDETEEEQA